MKKHQILHFKSPFLFSLYARIGIEWRRPLFTKDIAISVHEKTQYISGQKMRQLMRNMPDSRLWECQILPHSISWQQS